MGSVNLASYLENAALAHPDKRALIFEEQGQWTFREVNETSNQVANGMRDLGLKKGDRVILFLPNCAEFFFLYFGIVKMGGVINPLNVMLKQRELEYIIRDSTPKVVIVAKEVMGEPLKILSQPDVHVDKLIVIGDKGEAADALRYEEWISNYPTRFDPIPMDENDLAAILYTSGTTGVPKGVMLTHKNLWTNARHCADWAKTTYRDIGVAALPLFHSYALSHVIGESGCRRPP